MQITMKLTFNQIQEVWMGFTQPGRQYRGSSLGCVTLQMACWDFSDVFLYSRTYSGDQLQLLAVALLRQHQLFGRPAAFPLPAVPLLLNTGSPVGTERTRGEAHGHDTAHTQIDRYTEHHAIYSGAKRYLVSHQLCKFYHLKRWERPVIFIMGKPQHETKWGGEIQKITRRGIYQFIH